jgi:hypothetical protein
MNDHTWLAGLARAKLSVRYDFKAIHVIAPFRNNEGVAPVVLQLTDGYLRAPVLLEGALELCLRHLHRSRERSPAHAMKMTVQALLADRATAALKLPGRYVPTVDGLVVDLAAVPGSAAPSDASESDDESIVAIQSCIVSDPVVAEPPETVAPGSDDESAHGDAPESGDAAHGDAPESGDAAFITIQSPAASEPTVDVGSPETVATKSDDDTMLGDVGSVARGGAPTLSKKALKHAAQRARKRCR